MGALRAWGDAKVQRAASRETFARFQLPAITDSFMLAAGWLAGWLVGCWLAAWLAGWPAGWLANWLAVWLTGWLAGWPAPGSKLDAQIEVKHPDFPSGHLDIFILIYPKSTHEYVLV